MSKLSHLFVLSLWYGSYHMELLEQGAAHADKQDKYKVVVRDRHSNNDNNKPRLV